MLEQAITIAVNAHQGQKDKNGMPYILHPLRIMFQGKNLDEKIVGVLHDTLEDTNITAEYLRSNGFPEHIIEAIIIVSRLETETYEEFILKTKQNTLAKQIKIYDLTDNLDVKRLTFVSTTDAERMNKYLKALQVLQTD
ncbi:MAG TPA: hypothetical protein DCQ31_02130 [Bacteroidales bacterium]|nr:hypothetical protein [Bacteroidales bacterium]